MQRNGGFTVIELMVIFVIIGIIAAIAMPLFFDNAPRNSVFAAPGYGVEEKQTYRCKGGIVLEQDGTAVFVDNQPVRCGQ